MAVLQILNLRYLKHLLALVLVTLLASCAGGDGGAAAGVAASAPVGSNGGIATLNILGVSWTAPSEREDGSALALSEIASYHIYYGAKAGEYQDQINIDDPSVVSAQVEALPSGTYYLVVTAIDTDGRESLYSPEIVVTL